jgi:dTDP-4-dehydrorhamnose reductase
VARLLITGASGLLGANLLLAAHAEHAVTAVSHRIHLRLAGATCVQADLTQPQTTPDLLRAARPDAVIHCAALTDVEVCEADPELAERLNAEVPARLAEACAQAGARLIHISTDAVFDGEKGDYAEDDAARPINVYGATKLRAEQAVLAALPSATVIRTNLFGWNAQPKQSLTEWFLHNLRRAEACTGFTDVQATPLAADDLADWILRLIASNVSGVLHVAGRESVSKFDLGCRVAEVFGLDARLIRPGSVDDAPLRARRPHRLDLNVGRAEQALGAELPRLGPSLERWQRQEHDGTLDQLRSLIA